MYLKSLNKDNVGQHSGFDFTDYLPIGRRPGKWLPKVENIELCASGYHCFESKDLLEWMDDQLFEVELRGETIDGDAKTVGQQMRFVRRFDDWNERNLRLAACEIARKCVKKYWNNPDDTRPMDAIEVAERYANGSATVEELSAAASAAWSSAGSAWSSAGSAWSSAGAAWSSAGSAWVAAASAAWSAESARSSAGSSAGASG